jgi:hypothetical protein
VVWVCIALASGVGQFSRMLYKPHGFMLHRSKTALASPNVLSVLFLCIFLVTMILLVIWYYSSPPFSSIYSLYVNRIARYLPCCTAQTFLSSSFSLILFSRFTITTSHRPSEQRALVTQFIHHHLSLRRNDWISIDMLRIIYSSFTEQEDGNLSPELYLKRPFNPNLRFLFIKS